MGIGVGLFSRHAEQIATEALADTRVVVVNGARQVGKSTLAELIVAKQRNGPIGTVNLVFLHAQTKFENRAEDTGELPEE